MSHRLTVSAAALALAAFSSSAAKADEGMWTFDNFPVATVNQTYGTNIDQAWLDSVRSAAVRLSSGCSASVVSGQGLVLTNHHCVVSCVQDLSDAQNDYVQNGWMPTTRAEERQCPGVQAQILTNITDVTDQVLSAGAGLEGAAFVQARSEVTRALQEEACGDDDTRTCQVISFYRGGRFALYEYRNYTDVRLAFAPEFQAAFFGGDPDNFNYPRYALDAAFLRLYENGQVVQTPNHLTWNPAPPTEGEPVFVAGNPGSTSRLLTLAQLENLRDQQIPISQLQRSELRGRLIAFGERGDEERRVALDTLFGVENSFKAFYGQQLALNDASFMATKREQEAQLRAAVAADPALAQRIGDPWTELEAVQSNVEELYLPYRQLESAAGGGSTLYSYARAIVRSAQERARPAGQRLPEYASETALTNLRRRLADETPVSPELDRVLLSFWLSKTREYLTTDNPSVRLLLGDKIPEVPTERLATGTTLTDLAAHTALLDGGLEAVQASSDPLIQFVLRTEGLGREPRAQWEQRVSAPTGQAAERIAQARFAVYGDSQYPDATFSLRLSYGAVQGWSYRGVDVPPMTYIGGLYERATGAEPYNLAPRWAEAEGRVNKQTVYDFVSTNDIIGGNSGSPVINAAGEVIGTAFDGNIHSLGGAFGYDGELNRTVSVSTAAVTEALRTVYRLPHLLEELGVE
ncbi:MAG: S46 family peptidase [Brevundimonas sp.]|uniref:S46 family peptidase n=1 Tax=Brevundimonas sp. TaxID=1871086 RepID=UPI00391B9503